ncbi:rod shape-determining protein MreD [Thalassospira sp.]|uniref:rod shape-determining protein MreD n=1 Tax=Thalassospira sp. TaxID=1912094 RepID=UPI002736337C|nr:rod shape-determining protein MreD [Thalassospira sp.]MDP2697461.1 rod shape-determining protein MreD [Thalassospira sp.]
MKPGFWHRLDTIARCMVPAFSVFVLLLISLVPVGLPMVSTVTPALTLMSVFYWSINRPDLLTALAAFIIGLVQDLLTGLPLGVSSLVLLIVQTLSANQGRFFQNKSFAVLWWAFALVALAALLVQWLFTSALIGALLPFKPLVTSYILTAALFPLIAWVLTRVQNGLLQHV